MTRLLVSSGTLIIAVLFQDGIVIAGDKAGAVGEDEDAVSKVSISEVKVFPLKQNLIFASCGDIRILGKSPGDPDVFNINNIVEEYAASRDFTFTNEFWENLNEKIREKYYEYLSIYRQRFESSIELIFFYLDERQTVQLVTIEIEYAGDNRLPKIKIMHNTWFQGLFVSYGHTDVPDELLYGTPRTRLLAKHASIKHFLDNQNKPQNISLERALIFIKKIMEASSTMEPSRQFVSAGFDYLVLTGQCPFVPLT